jgi:ribosomal protein L34
LASGLHAHGFERLAVSATATGRPVLDERRSIRNA